jgi:hypothetical protein
MFACSAAIAALSLPSCRGSYVEFTRLARLRTRCVLQRLEFMFSCRHAVDGWQLLGAAPVPFAD